MTLYIPLDVVNYICELAAGENTLWYPFFSPNTGRLTWKINPYSSWLRWIARSDILPAGRITEKRIIFYNHNTGESYETLCRYVRFLKEPSYYRHALHKKYIEFPYSNDPDNVDMFRGWLLLWADRSIVTDKSMSIYLNNTKYAYILDGDHQNEENEDLHYLFITYQPV
ncbi:MAG: hypothetical protein ACOVRN_04605 [Flavobacterium sp.]